MAVFERKSDLAGPAFASLCMMVGGWMAIISSTAGQKRGEFDENAEAGSR